MHISPMLFGLVLVGFAALLAWLLFRLSKQESASSHQELQGIVMRLKRIDREAIRMVAMDEEHALEPEVIVDRLGGLRGLEALEFNANVLIDLATYVQRWHPEALPVAEQLRLNARQLKWNVGRLRGASSNGHMLSGFPAYAHSAAEIYYGMTREVIRLYERFDDMGMQSLPKAI